MFDLSFVEILFIAVLSVLVLGPKEFPVVLRQIFQWIGQLKSVGDEVRGQLHELVEDSGVKQVQKEIEQETQFMLDQNGEYREVYDISEFLDEETQQPKVTMKEKE